MDNSYLISTIDKVTDIGDGFLELTGYTRDDLLHKHISEVLINLLRLRKKAFEQITIKESITGYIFTKKLDAREVTISLLHNHDDKNKKYVVLETPDFRLDDNLVFEKQLFIDNKLSIGIYSVPDLLLLKASQKHIDFLDAPYNILENSIGRSHEDIYNRVEGSQTDLFWKDILKTQKTNYIKEFKYEKISKEISYWDGSYTPIFVHGKMKYILVNAADVTERVLLKEQLKVDIYKEVSELKEAEKKIHLQNQLLNRQATLLNLSKEAIFVWDLNGVITYWNNGAENKYGYSAEEALGRNSDDLLKTVYPGEIDEIRSLLLKNGSWEGEIEHTAKDGEKLIIDTRRQVIKDESANQTVLEINRNITERKMLEKQLFLKNEQMLAIIEDMSDGLTVCDKDGNFLIINSTAKKMLERIDTVEKAGEIASINEFKYLDGTPVPVEEMPLKRALRGDLVLKSKLLVNKTDGSSIILEVNATPVYKDKEMIMAVACFHDITDLEMSHKELNIHKEKLETIIDNMSDALLVFDANGKYTQINKIAKQMFSLDTGDILEVGDSLRIMKGYDESGNLLKREDYPFARILRGETISEYKMIIQISDKIIYSEINANPIYSADGKFLAGVICCHDITGEVLSTQLLKDSEKKYRELIETANSLIIKMDNNGMITYINNFALQFFGYTIDEVLGADIHIFIPEIESGSNRVMSKMVEEILRDPDDYNESINENIKKNGELVWISWRNRAIRNQFGDITGNLTVGQDITERRLVENVQTYLLHFGREISDIDAFQALARYLAKVLKMDYVCIDSLEGDLKSARTVAVFFDGKFEDNVSYLLKDTPCGDVVGKTICSFPIGVKNLFPKDKILQDMAAEGYIGTTLYSSVDQPIGLIALISRKPITNLKLVESILNLVGIRTASELERRRYEEEIIKSKEMAEAAALSKSGFLANMSHEIRTPMSGMIGMLNAILSTDLTDQQKEYLNLAKTASGTLLRVVNDILDYSKIDAGYAILEKSIFDLNDTIHEVVNLFNISAMQKGIEIKTNIDGNIPKKLTGDPVRLRQILSNIVGNAVKFTNNGSVTATVRQIESQNKKVTVLFDIADTGIGISENNMDKLFKSFSQIDNSNTKQFGGTGLGLVISKQLIKMMNGEIWVRSKAGVGSTFSFTVVFDLGEEQQDSAMQSHINTKEISGTENNTAMYTILLTEDEEINRKVGIYYLQKAGYQVIAASNGKEAIDLLKNNEIDLILMDVQMPEMDGLSAAKQIRLLEASKSRSVPIIAMTAYTSKSDQMKCIEAGMNDYLAKPINPDELYEKLKGWLGLTMVTKSTNVAAPGVSLNRD